MKTKKELMREELERPAIDIDALWGGTYTTAWRPSHIHLTSMHVTADMMVVLPIPENLHRWVMMSDGRTLKQEVV